jgi:peptidoglycan/LPS O-acetylase OafA/YrhL
MIGLEDIPVFPLTLKFNMDDDIVSRLKSAKWKNTCLRFSGVGLSPITDGQGRFDMAQDIKNEQFLTDVQRFNFIDALRGWAFLLVLIGHVDQRVGFPSLVANWLVPGSEHGVQLFFIVSAFTLLLSLNLRKPDSQGTLSAFFVRRFFRVAPLFWLAMLFYLALNGFQSLYEVPKEITWPRVLSTFFFMHGWHPNTINNVVPGGWTIAVEMNFYLLLPFFFRVVTTTPKAVVTFLILLTLYPVLNLLYLHVIPLENCLPNRVELFLRLWLPSQLPVFALGFILFFLAQNQLATTKLADLQTQTGNRKQAGLLLLIAASLFIFARPMNTAFIFRHILFGFSLFFLAWALAIHPFPFFVNRFTIHLGKISYSAYLCHFFVINMTLRAFFRLGSIYQWPFIPNFYFSVLLLVTLAITFLIATLTYRIIEVPFQKLGKKIIHRWA